MSCQQLLKQALLLVMLMISALSYAEDYCLKAQELLQKLTPDELSRSDTTAALNEEKARYETLGLSNTYCNGLYSNLLEKQFVVTSGGTFNTHQLIERAIRYERFRLDTYISSGVSPKRYFGFIDLQGNTATHEQLLQQIVNDAASLINDYAKHNHLAIQVTPKEILVTFLAEGGALLLSKNESDLEHIHPRYGIGLDDFRTGFSTYEDLTKQLDDKFNTNLLGLTFSIGSKMILLRRMTFREAVLGTAIMYLFEKELAAKYMRSQWHEDLMKLPLNDQFIATSLVYNSGILFSRERVAQIKSFTTAEYLSTINQKSARPKLAVYDPPTLMKRLKNDGAIPQQLTAWSAVYHVLQRYGAWVALDKFY